MAALPPLPRTPDTSAPAGANRLQRLYFGWAEKHYARMDPALAAEARRLDRWLYSRGGLGLLLGLAGAVTGSVAGLVATGFPVALAVLCSLLVWLGLPTAALGAWLQPHKFTARQLLRRSLGIFLLGYAGAFVGFLVGRLARPAGLQPETLLDSLWAAARAATPFLLVALAAITLLVWGMAQWREQHDRRELAQMRLVQERDAAARQAAEAQLRLLQAQVQPHFIFNTLAAVQHWVDTADPRAGPLLRSLSTFLRGSTELLAREQVSLGEELALAGHYLATLQARLGERLHFKTAADPALAALQLPPGLLLTLVENAVEHGIAPALRGGTVRVEARRTAEGWQLCVSDDGQGLASGWQEGVGLANCRQRLHHHFGGRARLTLQALHPGTRACIEVAEPVVSQEAA
ncbi:sensor histidine kinase [Rubrivivax rivuli]|uniref:Histidine kinase/HSP90-like ATPase domain-containing protein n=1 Tax=Rubrivivax rivuli TaxID=1862385 RepID=A0A437RQV9_9BURK|nr:histidine kinase [Rubrivivax rivuli]RVU49180.1 hypothetical protein EOE66_00935 [Rubrivivax rivuli]